MRRASRDGGDCHAPSAGSSRGLPSPSRAGAEHPAASISFLEVHKAELRETERVIAKANEHGCVRQIEMNERKRNNLVHIITSLEQLHA